MLAFRIWTMGAISHHLKIKPIDAGTRVDNGGFHISILGRLKRVRKGSAAFGLGIGCF